jgi:hypothetical protein
MKKLTQIWALPTAILFMLLSTIVPLGAAPPATLYQGGNYDGYDIGSATNLVLGQRYYVFLGGVYDGFDYGFIRNSEMPRLPDGGTLVIIQ